MPQSTLFQQSRTIKIPELGHPPGPIHTIIPDNDGGLILTDEINHALFSIDETGSLRWQRKGQGREPGQFWYPMGIDLGRVEATGSGTACVAVCDAWNGRIQFFSPDGEFLCQWTRAGEDDFKEVVDIRFLASGPGNEHDSCWLVLDRRNQRLYGMSLQGQVLFRIGRPFQDGFEYRWAKPRLSFCNSSDPSVFDPLFFPLRIFGSSPEALFVWEPKSRRLKQICQGNLLPVLHTPLDDGEWIAADAGGFLLWNRQTTTVSSYDLRMKTWSCEEIEGMHVTGGRSSREIWVQNGGYIRHLVKFTHLNDAPVSDGDGIATMLSQEIERVLQDPFPPKGILDLEEAADQYCALARSALALGVPAESGSSTPQIIREQFLLLSQRIPQILSGLQTSAHSLFLVLLKLHIFRSQHPEMAQSKDLDRAVNSLIAKLRFGMGPLMALLECKDNCTVARVNELANSDEKDGPAHERLSLLEEVERSLPILIHLAEWSCPQIASSSAPGDVRRPAGWSEPCPWIWIAPLSSSSNLQSRYFRELDRISLGESADAAPSGPCALAHTENNGLLVTLNSSSLLLRLNENGTVLGPLDVKYCGPYGVSMDQRGRIWVSEPLNNCIKIYDPRTKEVVTLDKFVGCHVNLSFPQGICPAGSESVLIADMGRHRILSVTQAGEIRILFDRMGKDLGEFRHPFSISKANSEATFWVIDRRNHRLQEVSLTGTAIREIGSPGPESGCLIYPESASVFNDGTIAVVQGVCTRALKLFSPAGDELETLPLDYLPRGTLLHQNLLLVCDGGGSHIRVYERID